jgi:hypothetical protein
VAVHCCTQAAASPFGIRSTVARTSPVSAARWWTSPRRLSTANWKSVSLKKACMVVLLSGAGRWGSAVALAELPGGHRERGGNECDVVRVAVGGEHDQPVQGAMRSAAARRARREAAITPVSTGKRCR